jgi:predicted nucleotidyltransferase
VLRIPPEQHAALRRAARDAGLSLNEYCAEKLATPGDPPGGPSQATVRRALAVFGDHLVGVVAYGSWARGEMVETSDVDLLVVLDRSLPVTRDLYRAWDAAPLRWNDHPVEPHFVHVPDERARVSGTWAEAATDGIVLFERGLELSRLLVRIRGRILSRHLERREVQGQPYWVEAR